MFQLPLLFAFTLLASIAGCAFSGVQAGSEHLKLATEQLSKGDLAGAESEARLVLQENPQSGGAYNILGQIRARQNLHSEAEGHFVKAVQSTPKLEDAWENLAVLRLLRREYAEARAAALELLRLNPTNSNGHLVVGIVAYKEADYSTSLKYLQPIAESESRRDPLPIAVCVEGYKRLGRTGEAKRLEAVLADVSVLPQDALLAAQVFEADELQPYVIRWLHRALDHGVKSFELFYQLGKTHRRVGQLHLAEKYYREALSTSPSDVNILIKLSEVREQLGDSRGALEYLYLAKKAPKKDFPTLMQYSLTCIRKRMFIDAKETLQQALELQPSAVRAHYLLGITAHALQNFGAAEKELRFVLMTQPDDTDARLALGVVLLSTSRPKEAEKEFQMALRTDPVSGAPHYYLAQIYRREGRIAEAKQELREAIRLIPDDARAYSDLAGVEISQGHFDAARETLNTALRLDKDSARAHYHLGVLLRRQGKTEQAKHEFELAKKFREAEEKNAVVLLLTKDSKEYSEVLRFGHQ